MIRTIAFVSRSSLPKPNLPFKPIICKPKKLNLLTKFNFGNTSFFHGGKNSDNKIQNRINLIKTNSCSLIAVDSKLQKRWTTNENIPKGAADNNLKANDVSQSTAAVELPVSASLSLKNLLSAYSSLAKFRLGSLVVVTTMFGYWAAPAPFLLSSFLYSSIGTTLAVASANTFNQIIEIEKDAKMNRTLKRILPTGQISVLHAALFGVATGVTGTALLSFGVNNLAAALAFSNIFLYTCFYTPMKQMHPINTWVGSVVGAIPPMIGWASATGGLEAGAWALATLLYVWQIPHFLALSWNLRHDYAKAGYKMLSNLYPEKVPAATLRWSLYLLPMGALCAWSGITDWTFAIDSLFVDSYVIYAAYKFYKDNSSANARKTFFATLSYLPLFLVLMVLHNLFLLPKPDKEEENKKTKEKLTSS